MDVRKVAHNISQAFSGFIENRDYGHLYILNEYAQVPFGTRVLGRIQHGWDPNPNIPNQYLNNFFETFVWSEQEESIARKMNWKNFHAIGAPWIYLHDILREKEKSGFDSHGSASQFDELWVYGAHATIEYENPSHELLEFMRNASISNGHRRAVLLSHYDFLAITKFRDNFPSLKLLTLGPRRDRLSSVNYLQNLRSILLASKKIVMDYPSTLLLYAIDMGCEVTWFSNKIYERALNESVRFRNESLNLILRGQLTNQDQKIFSDKYLGYSTKKTREELTDLMRWDESSLRVRSRLTRSAISVMSGLPRYFRGA